ncbi:MAG: helix-turn-helix transcriptional regulator [Hyphomicrobiaceae bacterium]
MVLPEGQRRSTLLTTVEAGEYLRMSPRTLEEKRVDGTGPRYFKLGPGKRAKVVYRIEDLEAWLAQHQFGSTSEYGR